MSRTPRNCHKQKFRTRKAAEREAKRMNRGQRLSRGRVQPLMGRHHADVTTYFCGICSCYHLTGAKARSGKFQRPRPVHLSKEEMFAWAAKQRSKP